MCNDVERGGLYPAYCNALWMVWYVCVAGVVLLLPYRNILYIVWWWVADCDGNKLFIVEFNAPFTHWVHSLTDDDYQRLSRKMGIVLLNCKF